MSIIGKLRTDPKLRRITACIYSLLGHNCKKIKGIGNEVITQGTFRKGCKIRVYGNNNRIVFAESVYRISNINISIYGDDNQILIGENFATDGLCFSVEDNNNKIIVGKNCHGGGHSELAAIEGTHIILGDDCMLSANITIRTGDSHSVLDALTRERINKSKSVVIGNHVWIGNTVLIFKGTQIGDNSIVAGGSVVTGKTFPKNCIVGGNPAKVIKEGADWCSERI